jgi:hypothetical protein
LMQCLLLGEHDENTAPLEGAPGSIRPPRSALPNVATATPPGTSERLLAFLSRAREPVPTDPGVRRATEDLVVLHGFEVPTNMPGLLVPPGEPVTTTPFLGVRSYYELADAVFQVDRVRFEQCSASKIFVQDENVVLLHRIRDALLQRHLLQVGRIYAVLPLSMVTAEIRSSDNAATVELVQRVMQQPECKWKITVDPLVDGHDDGRMVEFSPLAETKQADDQQNWLELQHVTHLVQRLEIDLVTSRRYQGLVRNEHAKKVGRSSSSGFGHFVGPRGVEDF